MSRIVLAVDEMVHCLLPFAAVEYVFLFIKSILYFVQSIHRWSFTTFTTCKYAGFFPRHASHQSWCSVHAHLITSMLRHKNIHLFMMDSNSDNIVPEEADLIWPPTESRTLGPRRSCSRIETIKLAILFWPLSFSSFLFRSWINFCCQHKEQDQNG